MSTKKIGKFKQRLIEEYQKLVRQINRNRISEEEVLSERVIEEGDLATQSFSSELLNSLKEGDIQRLRAIEQALHRIDSGTYGDCNECGEPIHEKRLLAVPWATVCIECQENAEGQTSSRHGQLKTVGVLLDEEEEEE